MRLTIQSKDKDNTIIADGIMQQHQVRIHEGQWYFSPDLVDMSRLVVTERTYTCPYKGVCFWIDLVTPDLKVQNVAWVYQNPKPDYTFIKDQIGFYSRPTKGTIAVQQVVTK